MTTNYTQTGHIMSVETPLGKDVLLLDSFEGTEELSRLFEYRLMVLSQRTDIAPDEILCKPITISLDLGQGVLRYLHGHVRSLVAGAPLTRNQRSYRLVMVPWLWFLTRTTDCRIFQNKSVKDIVQEIFAEMGFDAFETGAVQGNHPVRAYCVQYRESDFDFISRLLEEEGIFYYFRHEHSGHTLVLADQRGAYRDCPEHQIEYSPGTIVPDHINSWEHCYEFRSGRWAQTDYDFTVPRQDLGTSEPTVVRQPLAQRYELFDYPGGYEKKADGQALTRLRIEEEELHYDTVEATSACRSLFAGGKFTLERHDGVAETGKNYLITRLWQRATSPSYTAGSGPRVEYENSFACIPASVTFRPARITPKPVMPGPQTAIVTGPPGEEVYVDRFGRIKVQFPWDRLGRKDEKSSCWLRVAQSWAGRNWGTIHLPRIGQEVVVAFLDGNPDRPLVVGSVYNGMNLPPHDLPAKAPISGVRTNSTKGGGGSNEIFADDTKGREKLTLHAQRDMETTVENDQTLTVKHDMKTTVEDDQTLAVKGQCTETVTGDDTRLVKGNIARDAGMACEVAAMRMTLHGTTKLDLLCAPPLIPPTNRTGSCITMTPQTIELTAGSGKLLIGPAGVQIFGFVPLPPVPAMPPIPLLVKPIKRL